MMLPFGLNIAIIIVIALIILICIIGAIFLIAWAFRRPVPASSLTVSGPAGGSRTPLQIAQERYARGEINREEYLQIVSDLQKQA